MHQGGCHCIAQQQHRLTSKRPQVACGHQTHVQQEEGQHAFEQISREGLHGCCALWAHVKANHHAGEQEQLCAIGKRLMQDRHHATRVRCGGLPLGPAQAPLANQVGQDHSQDDGWRLHKGHGGSHVATMRHTIDVQKLIGGDKSDRTD